MASRQQSITALLATVATLATTTMGGLHAADPVPTAAQADFFEKRIRPLLIDACYRCHSAEADAIKGGLRLDSRAALLKGGETGTGFVPGDPARSRLIEAVSWDNPDFQMPPRRRLSAAQVADLTAWVRDGAPWPAESGTAIADRAREAAARARNHWAFQPVVAPARPVGVEVGRSHSQ